METRAAMEIVRRALKKSRKLRVTFKPGKESLEGVRHLLGMTRFDFIIFKRTKDRVNLSRAIDAGEWVGNDRVRTVVIILTNRFEENWFGERIPLFLESVTVA